MSPWRGALMDEAPELEGKYYVKNRKNVGYLRSHGWFARRHPGQHRLQAGRYGQRRRRSRRGQA